MSDAIDTIAATLRAHQDMGISYIRDGDLAGEHAHAVCFCGWEGEDGAANVFDHLEHERHLAGELLAELGRAGITLTELPKPDDRDEDSAEWWVLTHTVIAEDGEVSLYLGGADTVSPYGAKALAAALLAAADTAERNKA